MKLLKQNLSSAAFVTSGLLVGIAFLVRSIPVSFSGRSIPQYKLQLIRTLPGEMSIATSLNNAGHVVGYFQRANGTWGAFLWKEEHVTTFGTSGTRLYIPHALNEDGNIVVGHTGKQRDFDRIFVQRIHAVKAASVPASSAICGRIYAINSSGDMAGYKLSDGSKKRRACVWQKGVVTELGTLGGQYSNAFGINDSGSVVGTAEIRLGVSHAFEWRNGLMRDLGTLGGDYSVAYGINNKGSIVGCVNTQNEGMRAFLYKEGKMTNLGTLGGSASEARAINEAEQIVGTSMNSQLTFCATLWLDGEIRDLNRLIPPTPGLVLTAARDINNRGQILCEGTLMGKQHAYLLTPVL
ncbi:MAG TPA: hypothetical protein VNJ09_01935 [Chthonomonadales bacterium]|nr:hypothetical protein [Chthonomonadales bacterium]